MWRRPGTLVAAVIVAGTALVPLFGDPRSTPVTHPLWARLLLRALEMSEATRTSTRASQVFALLTWRDSISVPAEAYMRADGVSARQEAGRTVLTATGVPAEVAYPLAVVQPGDYLLRARIAGPSGAPVIAEIVSASGSGAAPVVIFTPSAELDWAFGGVTHLDPGSYRVQFLLPAGASLAHIELAPPCLNPIEPPGGWRPLATTTDEDLAVTALEALDAEYELPPAASPVDISGAEFLIEAPAEASARRAASSSEQVRTNLSAGAAGLRAVTSFTVPEAGLYSFFAFGAPGAGQRWLLDGCRKVVVCAGEGERWRPVLTQRLAAGRHLLALTLGVGASLQHVRIEQKKDQATHYVATLTRLGFSPGAAGPLTRARALDAAAFVRERRRALLAAMCGDPVLIEAAPLVLTARAPDESPDQNPPQPPAPPVVPPPEPVEPPIGPPLLPPQPPATPTEPATP